MMNDPFGFGTQMPMSKKTTGTPKAKSATYTLSKPVYKTPKEKLILDEWYYALVILFLAVLGWDLGMLIGYLVAF
jgi:hypothetical protein